MVNIPKFFKDDEADSDKLLLPLLPLRDIVIFPHMVAPLFVGREKSVNALSDAMNKDKEVFLATQRKAGVDNPGESDISHVGTIGKVLQLLRLPDGTVKALVEGKARARIDLVGHGLFLIPVAGFIFFTSLPYVAASWRILEKSSEVGGLPAVFALKTLIPLMAALLFLQGASEIIKRLTQLRTMNRAGDPPTDD